MLNPFPELLSLSFFAPLLLRVAVGFMFLNFGIRKLFGRRMRAANNLGELGLRPGRIFVWVIGIVEIAAGIMLVLGLFTQIAALVMAGMMCIAAYAKTTHPQKLEFSAGYYLLLGIVCISLLSLGAGAFAIDLPL